MHIGPYEILGDLGRGGMGVVHRARSPHGEEVAVKVLTVTVGAEALAVFAREKRLLWSFGRADGFVPVRDSGEDAGRPYLVMPLIPGGTLRARLKAGRLGVDEALALARELARAIGNAHERGIVHRDLKPENVLFTEDGEPLIADLGLAKHFRKDVFGASASALLSETGVVAGTPGYMAPEQLMDSKGVGPAADVFALGVLLYETLAGTRPFGGRGLNGYAETLLAGPARPLRSERPDVPRWLEMVVARALEREPSARFPDALALRRALSPEARSRRHRVPIAPVLAVGVLVAAVAFAMKLRAPARPPLDGRTTLLLGSGDVKLRRNDYDGAIADYTRVIELDPGAASAWAGRSFARTKKDVEGAIADSTRAIALDPSYAPAWAARSGARAKTGDIEGAIADSTRAIALDPRYARGWAERAVAKIHKSDYQGAIADETRAIELDPKCARSWLNRGIAKMNERDYEGAIADLTRAIELDPKFAGAWAKRGRARMLEGDRVGASADLDKAIELEPEQAEPWHMRGLARLDTSDRDGAIADFTRAIELAPTDARFWLSRAAAKAAMRDWDGTIADCTRAIERDPREAVAWSNRAAAKEKLGDLAGARADFERFLGVAPDHAYAPGIRKWLAEHSAGR